MTSCCRLSVKYAIEIYKLLLLRRPGGVAACAHRRTCIPEKVENKNEIKQNE